MADAARHHYVPQFHLRMFGHADGNGRIWAYDKRSDAITRRSVRAVASEINYYRIRDGKGGHADELEGLFSYIESGAAPLIRRLSRLAAGEHFLHPVHRDTLAGYIALLHVRGPTERRKTLAMGEFLARAQIDMVLRNPDALRAQAASDATAPPTMNWRSSAPACSPIWSQAASCSKLRRSGDSSDSARR